MLVGHLKTLRTVANRTSVRRNYHVSPITPAVTVTVRDALNMALKEELARDPTTFLMGEEVGRYQGAYKVSKGLVQEFGENRVVDSPITESGMQTTLNYSSHCSGFGGLGVGAAMSGWLKSCNPSHFLRNESHHRVHDNELCPPSN